MTAFVIKNRWTGATIFETDLPPELDGASYGDKIGAAVKIALGSGSDLSGSDLSGSVVRFHVLPLDQEKARSLLGNEKTGNRSAGHEGTSGTSRPVRSLTLRAGRGLKPGTLKGMRESMLVLSRKTSESVVLNCGTSDESRITVVEIRDGKVKLGIDAPAHVKAHRLEVWLSIQGKENLGKLGEILRNPKPAEHRRRPRFTA